MNRCCRHSIKGRPFVFSCFQFNMILGTKSVILQSKLKKKLIYTWAFKLNPYKLTDVVLILPLSLFSIYCSGEFTIHGLWPQYSSGGYPQSCAPNNKFSTSNLQQTLLNQMSCEWVSYTGTNAGFWSYEWGKHGTCALSLFPTQQDYFNAAITTNNKYEVTVSC